MNLALLYSAQEFRRRAEAVWSEATAFPGQYDRARPSKGQCGVTSICLGLWLAQERGFALDRMQYVRGQLLSPRQTVVGPNHSWLGVQSGDGSWRVDLTADQYPETPFGVVIQAAAGERDYKPEKSTPFAEYDTARMHDRLIVMAGALSIDLAPLTHPPA